MKPYPSFGGQESLLILQESQKPLFQQGRIPSSLLDIPRPVPLYCISYLLGSVCGVDFLPGYLFFPSTARKGAQGCAKVHEGVQMCTKRCTIVRKRYARCMQVHERCGQVCKGSTEVHRRVRRWGRSLGRVGRWCGCGGCRPSAEKVKKVENFSKIFQKCACFDRAYHENLTWRGLMGVAQGQEGCGGSASLIWRAV